MNEIAAQYEAAIKYSADHDAIGEPIGFNFTLHHPDRGVMTFKKDTPRGIVADALEESGRDEEATTLRKRGAAYHDHGKIYPQRWAHFTDSGGYPLYYLMQDGGIHCPTCANNNFSLHGEDPQWTIRYPVVNWEDADLTCDNCNKPIDAAYGEEADTTEE